MSEAPVLKPKTEVEVKPARKVSPPPFRVNAEGLNGGRRRVPRRAIQRKIGLLVSGQYWLATAYEIGEGGVLIDSPVPLMKDQKAVVTIRIPGTLQGVMLACVVYVMEPKAPGETHRYGLQFDEVTFDVKRKIRNFVASSKGALTDAPSES